jgi:hypothetical protein
MQRLWSGLLAACVVLCGCSKLGESDACVEEFVQEFELDDAGLWMQGTPCEGQDIDGPPKWPHISTTFHIEYSGGDYFTVMRRRDWNRAHNNELRCSDIEPTELVIYIRNTGGKEESVTTRDGVVISGKSFRRDLREQVIFGKDRVLAPVRGEGLEGQTQKTEFGVDCAMTRRRIEYDYPVEYSACMPAAPTNHCEAFNFMAPFHQTGVKAGTKSPITGRTTSYKSGKSGSLVDKSKWVMPPNDL